LTEWYPRQEDSVPHPEEEQLTRPAIRARLSADGLDALHARARQDVESGLLPACSYALALDGEVLVHETVGEVAQDARFSIWSSTKPVFASVVWQLIGEGALDPAAPVVELWPEFGAHGKDAVTLEHLLLFTAGFPQAGLDLATIGDREARVGQMEQWRLDWGPGTQYGYHGLSAHYVMAELVERVTGTDHRTALRDRVLDPLGLERLELGVPPERLADVLPLVAGGEPTTAAELAEALGMPDLPAPVTEQIAAAAAAGPSVAAGADLLSYQQPHVLAHGLPGAGAVSDAASLALFYQALLHNDEGLWDPVLLRTVTTQVRNVLPDGLFGSPANRSLGLCIHVPADGPMSRFSDFGSPAAGASPAAFGHSGAAGQIAWADPVTGLSFVYLTNGLDRNVVRLYRRGNELAGLASTSVEPR
jgi:CubicO group peptidase (beta-lactamase class C family)